MQYTQKIYSLRSAVLICGRYQKKPASPAGMQPTPDQALMGRGKISMGILGRE